MEPPSMASSADYDVCVAMDIGTTYSSYAYSPRRTPANVVHREWGNNYGIVNLKTPTVVLWNKQTNASHSVGEAALNTFMEMDESEAKSYVLCEKFKLKLMEPVSTLVIFYP
jgi:hypothetical protein